MTLRSSSLTRTAELRRETPVARVNKKRKASAFVRCYFSKARVEFVSRLHCIVDGCESTRSENAHLVNDGSKGAGRKSGYKTVGPACREHHHELDEVLGRDQFEIKYGLCLQDEADKTEAAWQRFLDHGGEAEFPAGIDDAC
jgi:hypothetical protein